MKIEKTQAKPAYKPITLTITIESEMEEAVLRAMGRADLRIPDMLVYGDPNRNNLNLAISDYDICNNTVAHSTLSNILNILYQAL